MSDGMDKAARGQRVPSLYRFVGPPNVRAQIPAMPGGTRIRTAGDLEAWLARAGRKVGVGGSVVATFVVDEEGELRLSDRHTEHAVCAGGRPVQSAGEMTFRGSERGWEVAEVSNQSTGYCPEPASWPAVASALARIPVTIPEGFTDALIFRRCPTCGQITIVKDGVFVCEVCQSPLPEAWNVDGIVLYQTSIASSRS